MGANLDAARQARSDKALAQLIRTSAYGITTKKERIERAIADGNRLEIVEVRDEARERAIEREMKSMMGNGWGVPTGNECHPITIKYNKLKAELVAGPKTIEYRMYPANEEYWNVLSKTEFDYAQQLAIS
jgi:hypothetical protein